MRVQIFQNTGFKPEEVFTNEWIDAKHRKRMEAHSYLEDMEHPVLINAKAPQRKEIEMEAKGLIDYYNRFPDFEERLRSEIKFWLIEEKGDLKAFLTEGDDYYPEWAFLQEYSSMLREKDMFRAAERCLTLYILNGDAFPITFDKSYHYMDILILYPTDASDAGLALEGWKRIN